MYNNHEHDLPDHVGSEIILRVSNIEKQENEIITTQAKSLGRSEHTHTHTNKCTNEIIHATQDMHLQKNSLTLCTHLEKYNMHTVSSWMLS